MKSSPKRVLGRTVAVGATDGVHGWMPADVRVPVAVEPVTVEPEAELDLALRAELAAAREAEERAQRQAETEAEIGRIRDEAFQSGYEEGVRAGELAESMRLRSAVGATEEALDELRAGEMRWVGSIEENLCALAVGIARHIVQREVTTSGGTVLEMVRHALAEFPIDRPMRIRVNPGDLAAIQQAAEGSIDPLRALVPDPDARWLPDPSIAPGGCMVEGRDRIVDGRVDTALERIYRRLTYTNA